MMGLSKVDVACISLMIVIVLTTAGYMAVFGGWTEVDGVLIWMGWVWWVVIGLVIVSLLIIIISSRKETG